MILSENYIERLKNLAGIELLTETDNRKVITDKIKLPSTIADWAHGLSDKYSIWIANTFKNNYLTNSTILNRMPPDVKEEVIKQITDGKIPDAIKRDMLKIARLGNGQYQYILDWLRGRNSPPVRETDPLNFKTLTFEDALVKSQNWHAQLEKLQGGAIKDEDGEIIMTFPDGFYWINLGKSRCEKEAEAMGHCGSGRGTLYSLRRDKHPYVTLDLVDGIIGQIKGRANTKPKKEFHQYIIPFLMDDNIRVRWLESSYQPHTDFSLNDLTDEQLMEILRKKPILFRHSKDAVKRLSKFSKPVVNDILDIAPGVFTEIDQTGLWDAAQIDYILQNSPAILERQYNVIKGFTKAQIDFALHKDSAVGLFNSEKSWATIEHWTPEHTGYILNTHPQFLDNQKILELKTAGKITETQVDWIVDKDPKILVKQGPTILLTFSKSQLKKVASEYPGSFGKLFDERFDTELVDKSAIDSEIISMIIHRLTPESDGGYKFYERFYKLPNDKITVDHLQYILENYPDTFVDRDFARYFTYPNIVHEAHKVIQYIIDNYIDRFIYVTPHSFKGIENWPFTDVQKDFLIKQQLAGNIDVLENQNLSKLKFSKKQIEKLIKEKPELFIPENQDFEALGITAKGIEYIVTKSPGTIKDKKVEEMLDEKDMKSLFTKNPNWTNSVYLQAKYRGHEGVKGLKESSSGGFKQDYVELLYEDWSDEEIGSLFDDKDKEIIKDITGDNVYDRGGYNYSYSDIDNNFGDLNGENTAYVIYLLKKAFTSQKGMYDADKMKIKHAIMAMKYSELADIIGDPDEFVETHKIESFNEHIVDELKDTFIRAIEDAQQSADESAVWAEFINPVKHFLGEPDWKTKIVKTKESTKRPAMTEERDFLRFKMSYDKFLQLMKIYEDVESSDYDYTILLNDGHIYPTTIIATALKESTQLRLRDLSYISGNIDDSYMNERFGELLHDNLNKELEGAKVVTKKKKAK